MGIADEAIYGHLSMEFEGIIREGLTRSKEVRAFVRDFVVPMYLAACGEAFLKPTEFAFDEDDSSE